MAYKQSSNFLFAKYTDANVPLPSFLINTKSETLVAGATSFVLY